MSSVHVCCTALIIGVLLQAGDHSERRTRAPSVVLSPEQPIDPPPRPLHHRDPPSRSTTTSVSMAVILDRFREYEAVRVQEVIRKQIESSRTLCPGREQPEARP